jgi:hypothetical protein
MSAPPRISRESPQHTRKPNLRVRRAHRKFINSLPCVACGAPAPSECAHVRAGTDAGMKQTPSDRYSLPLCSRCHRTGKKAQHEVGELRFWAALGIDPLNLACRLWTISGDIDAGERAVFRARQQIGLRLP